MIAKVKTDLDSIFLPRNVAIIGASYKDFFTWAIMAGKLKEHFFPVNPNYEEVMGKKCYSSILDIEEPVDYAILVVPSRMAIKSVQECIQKGVKGVHLFTSGFSETGTAENIKLEKELAALVKGRIRMIGPNCMGIYCPKSGLSFNPLSAQREGNIGIITQSGTFAQFFIQSEKPRNVRISKLISYGNAVDIDCPELLDYYADDPDTHIIALYIEGIRDGRLLKEALERAAAKKPVIALKGGMTAQGARVASSHTGSLAGSGRIWETMFQQAGSLLVNDIDELINTALAFSCLKPPQGKGIGIITYSGGFSVVQSDLAIKAGLDVPQLSDKAREKLRKIVPSAGTMIGNPLDAWQVFHRVDKGQGTLDEIIKIVADESQIDSIILQIDNLRFLAATWGKKFAESFESFVDIVAEGCLYTRDTTGKVIMISMYMDPFQSNELERKIYLDFKARCEEHNLAVYPSLNSAINTVSDMYRYTRLMHKGLWSTG
ncbi:MAG: acetate--CoA ligase family protein [Dehalococcoidia bacterium]